MRADFYGHLLAHPALAASLPDGQVTLGPMTADELHVAIERPARQAGLGLEPGLVELLLRDLTPPGTAADPGALPLLAHALLVTWQNRQGRLLTVAGYQLTGGIRAAVATTAERAFGSLDASGKDAARRLLLRLVQVGADTGQTRRRVAVEQLYRQVPDPALADVLAVFVRARLLTADTATVEITHEALLTAWPRLSGWIEADRAGLAAYQRLAEAAEAWRPLRSRALLYQGAPLVIATAWAADHTGELGPAEREFLDASTSEQQRGTRRLRRLVAVLSVLVLLSAAATGTALWQRAEARRAQDIAVSQKVAGQVAVLRKTNPALAMQLALAAYRRAQTVEARGAVLDSIAPYVTRYAGGGDWVQALAVAPDQRTLAMGTNNGITQLWDVTQPHRQQPLGVLPTSGHISAVAFRPGPATRILFTAETGQGRLWDVTKSEHPTEVARLDGAIRGGAFSPDGQVLATGDSDVVRLWRVGPSGSVTPLTVLPGHGVAEFVAFSPDGASLLTGGNGTVLLWDAHDLDRPPTQITMNAGEGLDAAVFGPDGRTLAVSGSGYDLRIYHVDADRHFSTPVRPATSDMLFGLAFSPDGTILATGGNDKRITLYDAATGRELAHLGLSSRLLSTAFTRDGDVIAGGVGGSVHVWHDPLSLLTTRGPRAVGPPGPELALLGDRPTQLWDVTDPGRRMLVGVEGPGAAEHSLRLQVTVAKHKAVTLWDIGDPTHPERLVELPIDDLRAAALHPGGRILVTGDNAGHLMIWDVSKPRDPRWLKTIDKDFDDVNSIAFADNGALMATADTNHGIWLWNTTDPANPLELSHSTAHTEAVVVARFSPNQQILVSAGYDWTARLWDVTGRKLDDPVTLVGHTDAVVGASFSPDGKSLLTAGLDNTIRVWSLADRRHPELTAVVSDPELLIPAYAADSRRFATVGDTLTRVWDTDVEAVAGRICAFAGARISPEEWRQHFGDDAYEPPC
nr:WD40 repeat domain-containing protein [Kutzneria chonburiensis]